MRFFSSYGSRGLIVLLATGAAFLAYENRQLTEALASARSDTLQCVARGPLTTPALVATSQGSGLAPEPSPAVAPAAAPLALNCPSPPPKEAEKPAPPAAGVPPKAAPKILHSLQDAFPPKPPVDTPPLSTVSPLGEGGWGVAKP